MIHYYSQHGPFISDCLKRNNGEANIIISNVCLKSFVILYAVYLYLFIHSYIFYNIGLQIFSEDFLFWIMENSIMVNGWSAQIYIHLDCVICPAVQALLVFCSLYNWVHFYPRLQHITLTDEWGLRTGVLHTFSTCFTDMTYYAGRHLSKATYSQIHSIHFMSVPWK